MTEGEISPEQAPATATTPDSPRVAVLSRDLFFGMRIRTTLRQMGYGVDIAQDASTYTEHLEGNGTPACLGLVDFNFPVDWDAVKGTLAAGVPTIAFGPHKDVEGFRAAKQIGVTRVISNGEFSRSLPDLVARYSTKPA